MKYKTIIALLGVSIASVVVSSGQIPSAVISDPPVDRQYPPSLAGLTVPSHGRDMDAIFYLASGAGPHPTVLLLHGLPGYEQNTDLAQSIRRAGWNVLTFNYRGSWGTAGTFSISSALEDAGAAVQFLQAPEITRKYHIDSHRLVLIGHSFGGFVAAYEAARNRSIAAVAMVAAINLGTASTASPQQQQMRLNRWQAQMHPLAGCTAEGLIDEARQHVTDWNYLGWAGALHDRPILIIEADDQNRTDNEALATALRRAHAAAFEEQAVLTDHSFSDHRIALQAVVVTWLRKLRAVPADPSGR